MKARLPVPGGMIVSSFFSSFTTRSFFLSSTTFFIISGLTTSLLGGPVESPLAYITNKKFELIYMKLCENIIQHS